MITIPRRKRGQSRNSPLEAQYQADLQAFCSLLDEIRSGLDFAPSARGWCYVLEEHGLSKGDFDTAENLINDCRKSGALPLDICGTDDKREFENV